MRSPISTFLFEAVVDPIRQATANLRRTGVHQVIAGSALAVVLLQPAGAAAHETDQDTLPLGREFADLRVPISQMVRGAIVAAVNRTNTAIQRSLRDGRPTAQTPRLQSADFIAGAVWAQLFAAFPTTEAVDTMFASPSMRARYPGLITVYRPEQSIYDDPLLLLDITKVIRTLFRGGTINVDGTLIGTDKIIHFLNLGSIYHSTYLSARQRGLGEAEATAQAVQLSAGSNPFLSERALLGWLSTGIYSNGDLAANYAGLKFYRNLTETVRIGEKVLPPMLVRAGPYWRLDDHVRDESDFFAAFVTPHWNEALNPNSYTILVDTRVRKMLRARCPDVVAWYQDERGQPRNREQFARIAQDLSTLYGEDYGHHDDGKDTVSIATTCFSSTSPGVKPAASEAAATAGSRGPDPLEPQPKMGQPTRGERDVSDPPEEAAVDRLGRTRLWWAARDGRLADIERLVAEGEDLNAADIDGETSLHAASRWGHTAVVEALLALGADPSVTALYGRTPLHVAVEESQLAAAQALLRHGADVATRDMFGASPLHQAAALGNRQLVALLLAYGADPGALDDSARTPVQLAARAGNEALAKWLVLYAQNPEAARALNAASDEDQPTQPGQKAMLRVSTGASPSQSSQPAAGAAAAMGE